MLDIKTALAKAYQQLQGVSDTARLDAQVLLCFVLDIEKPYLIAYDDRVLTNAEQSKYDALIARRASGEPIAYIVGYKDFWDMRFTVSPAVLIPRPETEHLIEVALEWLKDNPNAVVADIGTGSGAIAVTIAKHSNAEVHAIDVSDDALAIAQTNARDNQVNVTFHHGNLARPLLDALFQGVESAPQAIP
ncbi:MAG: HemK/PrmC family methyltransferase [Chloroflexota bacterium]